MQVLVLLVTGLSGMKSIFCNGVLADCTVSSKTAFGSWSQHTHLLRINIEISVIPLTYES